MDRTTQLVWNILCFFLCLVTPKKITKSIRFLNGIIRAIKPQPSQPSNPSFQRNH